MPTTKPLPCPHSTIVVTDDHSTSSEDLIQSCPAFSENGGCPFSQCSDEDEIRKKLLEIPASHFENRRGEQFKTILKSLHHGAREQLGMVACPVANLLEQDPHVSFTEAVEDFSLAAIMSKMAEEYQKKNNIGHGNDTEANQPSLEPARILLMTAAPAQKPGASSLSASFKNGTASAHKAAESVHFVANFIRGDIDRQLYADLVSQLYHVYSALEERLDQCCSVQDYPVLLQFQPFHEKLRRKKALEEDVDFWGPREIFQETKEYADRLRSLDPLLLLAHSYTRYLGDLSGGKILQRAARRALDLKSDGLAFYEFEHIKSAKLFKDEFRAAMDALCLQPGDVDRLVHEANIAFLLNMRIFEVLDVKANFPGATVRTLEEVLAFQPSTLGSNKCPFAKPIAGGVMTEKKNGRCPWPFIIFHDPVAALRDWQTWGLLGIVLSIAWSLRD